MVDPVSVRLIEDLPASAPSIAEAHAFCLDLARTHYENFTVLSWLAPRSMRRSLASVYAYCRTVDDIGDEASGDRLELLDRYEEQLDAAYAGAACHPVLVALAETIRALDLPREPFARLIEANRIDQRTPRYATFDALRDYCTYSADPVGRLVLMLNGFRDEQRFRWSDATCTALQLANFWQDVKRDHAAGRIYLPADEMAELGVRADDLAEQEATPAMRDLMRRQVDRTRDFFCNGLPLVDSVSGRLRVDLALFSGGGLAVLDAIERCNYDTLACRPTVGGRRKAAILVRALLRPRAPVRVQAMPRKRRRWA